MDSYTYSKNDQGEYYTSREGFEKQYTYLIKKDGIEKHFTELIDEGLYTQAEAKESLDKVRGKTAEETAYNIIEDSLNLLDGATVERKHDETAY